MSVSNELCHYFANNHGYRHVPHNIIGNGIKTNTTDGVQHCLHDANSVEIDKPKVPLFFSTSMKYIWVEKSPQVCKVIV